MKINSSMFEDQLKSFADAVRSFNVASEAAHAEQEGQPTPYKKWVNEVADVTATFQDLINFDNGDDLSPATLKSLLGLVDELRTNIDNNLYHHFSLTQGPRPTGERDLHAEFVELKSQYKGIMGMVDAGFISKKMVDDIVPIEYKKVGRATEPVAQLAIKRPPSTSPQVRSNSKAIQLFIDGKLAEGANLADAVKTHLGMLMPDFRALYGDAEGKLRPGRDVDIAGHIVRLHIEG